MKSDPRQSIECADFDLVRTLNSGQVFHWEKCGAGYAGTIGSKGIYVEQQENRLLFSGIPAEGIENYFALDHPLAEICRSFPDDAAMRAARDFCQGLRIMRQPLWECLATFITSSMKQVAHIRQISRSLRTRYGKRRRVFECEVYTFPPVHQIAELTEQELMACALGYRAKNLLATARLISSGDVDLERWSELSDELLREHLCELPGVGPKVANCVMLFAYERLCAFPIDVWIERVLKKKYFPRRRMVRAEELRGFTAKYFGGYGGYAQQYLFHYARTSRSSRPARADAPAA